MNPELAVDRREKLRRTLNGHSVGVLILLAALLSTAGRASSQDDPEPEPKKPKKSATKSPDKKPDKKPVTPKSKIEPAGAAGPSSEHPNWPLALWSDGPAVEWRAQAYACAAESEKLITGLEKAKSGTSIKKRIADVDRAHVSLLQLERLAVRLSTWSELAGQELNSRHGQLLTRLNDVVRQINSENQQLIADIKDTLRERCRKAQKNLDLISKMRDAGKFETAEARMIKLYDDLSIDGAWFPSIGADAPLIPFISLLGKLSMDVLPERQRAARDAMNRRREEQMPNYAEVIASVRAATAAVAGGRKFDGSGQALDAPQALESFLDRWQELYFTTLHVRAMDYALSNFTMLHDDVATSEPYRQFEQELVAALAKLIEADAGSAKADEIAPHHAAYVRALAPLLSLISDESTTRQFQAALDRLAEKSPTLASQLETYRLATSDMLRWSARLAAAQRAKAEPSQAAAVDFRGSLTSINPQMVGSLSTQSVGKPTVAVDLIGTLTNQRAAKAAFATSTATKNGVYCAAPLAAELQAASASLRASLLCAGSADPLTLETAMALARAERGDLAAVGGPIQRIEIDNVIALWNHANTWGLARPDRQPDLSQEPIRLRIELEPRWYYQTYAFIEVKPESR